MSSVLIPTYDVYSSMYGIQRELDKLLEEPILAFDTETQSIYSQEEIKEAKKILKGDVTDYSSQELSLIKQISKASGLSNPALVRVTHFMFSSSEDHTIILIANTAKIEQYIWDWLVKFKGKLLVHNILFDMKICHHRTGKLPCCYEDTMLMVRTLTNDADSFKARAGLKVLMGDYYEPAWTMLDEDGYNSTDFKKESFLQYCANDTSAVWKLYHMIMEDTYG